MLYSLEGQVKSCLDKIQLILVFQMFEESQGSLVFMTESPYFPGSSYFSRCFFCLEGKQRENEKGKGDEGFGFWNSFIAMYCRELQYVCITVCCRLIYFLYQMVCHSQ